MVHGVAHEHLVNTEMRDLPKSVVKDMRSAMLAIFLIFLGCWPGAHVGSACIPRHDGNPTLSESPRLISATTCYLTYLGFSPASRLGSKVISGQKLALASIATMTLRSKLASKIVTFLQRNVLK